MLPVNPHVLTWMCLLWRHREARVFVVDARTDNIATAYPKNRVPEGATPGGLLGGEDVGEQS